MFYRPGFGVVAFVVTVLCVAGVSIRSLRPWIPERDENRLAREPGEFMKQGARQGLDWRPLTATAFAEARNPPRPILLLIGTSASRAARDADAAVFTNAEIRSYLSRNFICVRVDGFLRPEWLNAYLPVRRAQIGMLPGFQCWILDPEGRPFHLIARTARTPVIEPDGFLKELVAARKRFDSGATDTDVRELHEADLALFERPPQVEGPDFASALPQLMRSIHPTYGGMLVHGLQRPLPHAWRLLLLGGEGQAFERSALPMLLSPAADLLDGGIFVFSTRPDWRGVQFDQIATHAADTMHTLSLAAKLTGSVFYRDMSLRSFDALVGPFMVDGLVAAARQGDEGPFNRSAASSVSARRLREVLRDPGDRGWAQERLGLRPGENPQMIPYLTKAEVLYGEPRRLDAVLGALRKARKPATYVGHALADVNGHVAARLLEVARMWGDQKRLGRASILFARLDQFRSGDDVVHAPLAGGDPHSYLGDYLAFSDAALQDFLASGSLVSLDKGLSVLLKARRAFAGKRPGLFPLQLGPTPTLMPQGSNSPDIIDGFGESCTARMVRLCASYARLVGGSRGKDLMAEARAGAAAMAAMVEVSYAEAAAYLCAVASLQDDTHAFGVGPAAESLAASLFARVPGRLVAPATGFVRPDLQNRAPGIYVVAGDSVTGPLSVEAAALAMGPILNLGTAG